MIKWCFFWKFLKQLFIISLISCFILLGNSFANANVQWYVKSVWSSSSSYNSWYSMSVSYLWVLGSSYLWENRQLLMFDEWNYFFWDFNHNPYISFKNWVANWQGYPSDFLLCDSLSSSNPSNCSCQSYIPNSWTIVSILKWWLDKYYYWKFVQSNEVWEYYQGSLFCFSNSSFNKSFCFYSCSHPNCWSSTTDKIWGATLQRNLSNSQNLSLKLSEIPNNKLWTPPWYNWTAFSPSQDSRLWWRLVVSSWYTNKDMVEGFECVWLTPSLCYWWFPIDNIFQPWEQFEDFTWYVAGQGASVFDLYNLYSWSFSNLNQFLNTVLTRYRNWQINSFITEPKALIMLGAQMNTAWFKTSYVSSYCNLLINRNNSILYTWDSVDDLRVQSCLRNKKAREWLKDSDWKDIEFQSTHSWIFSWDDVDFDPDTFFSSLMEEITEKLDNPLSWGAEWLIPWYIIIFTLALIFIRIISH